MALDDADAIGDEDAVGPDAIGDEDAVEPDGTGEAVPFPQPQMIAAPTVMAVSNLCRDPIVAPSSARQGTIYSVAAVYTTSGRPEPETADGVAADGPGAGTRSGPRG